MKWVTCTSDYRVCTILEYEGRLLSVGNCPLVTGTVNGGRPPGTKCPQVRFMAMAGYW